MMFKIESMLVDSFPVTQAGKTINILSCVGYKILTDRIGTPTYQLVSQAQLYMVYKKELEEQGYTIVEAPWLSLINGQVVQIKQKYLSKQGTILNEQNIYADCYKNPSEGGKGKTFEISILPVNDMNNPLSGQSNPLAINHEIYTTLKEDLYSLHFNPSALKYTEQVVAPAQPKPQVQAPQQLHTQPVQQQVQSEPIQSKPVQQTKSQVASSRRNYSTIDKDILLPEQDANGLYYGLTEDQFVYDKYINNILYAGSLVVIQDDDSKGMVAMDAINSSKKNPEVAKAFALEKMLINVKTVFINYKKKVAGENYKGYDPKTIFINLKKAINDKSEFELDGNIFDLSDGSYKVKMINGVPKEMPSKPKQAVPGTSTPADFVRPTVPVQQPLQQQQQPQQSQPKPATEVIDNSLRIDATVKKIITFNETIIGYVLALKGKLHILGKPEINLNSEYYLSLTALYAFNTTIKSNLALQFGRLQLNPSNKQALINLDNNEYALISPLENQRYIRSMDLFDYIDGKLVKKKEYLPLFKSMHIFEECALQEFKVEQDKQFKTQTQQPNAVQTPEPATHTTQKTNNEDAAYTINGIENIKFIGILDINSIPYVVFTVDDGVTFMKLPITIIATLEIPKLYKLGSSGRYAIELATGEIKTI